MQNENTVEAGNRKIALWLGWKKHYSEKHNWWLVPEKYSTGISVNWAILNFHGSYEWLMPVVERISKIWWTDFNNVDKKELESEKNKVCSLPISTPLIVIWKAVVDFIDWYNPQNTNKKANG